LKFYSSNEYIKDRNATSIIILKIQRYIRKDISFNLLKNYIQLFNKIKLAEHSFRVRFCWCNSAHAQGLQTTNMPSIERSFYLLNTSSICAIFLYNWTQRIDGFGLLLQRYVRKGNDAKNPAILSFFFLTERTQLNAVHA